MRETVIKVERIGKKYRIRHKQPERYVALRDVIAEKVRNAFRMARSDSNEIPVRVEDFWALKDVSFEVKRGEVVGIIGRNGAGKSTLLKILSRITEPTEGRAEIHGRVASLLEVGTGFHPELTGRENIYLNGAILGMERAEIKRRFDEIVAFAEVEKFLDTPIKRFSSGMYVRLAFAVAAHLEPDILVVDEVLAVGDVEFQKKCIGKIKSVALNDNRTVLFVSHNMAAIQTLCNQIVLLRAGRVVGKGDVATQIKAYLSDLPTSDHVSSRRLSASLSLDLLFFTPNPVASDGPCSFVLQFSSTEPAQLRDIAILIYAGLGTRVAILDLRAASSNYRLVPGERLRIQGCIHSIPLVEGDYSIGVYVDCGDFCGDVYDLARLSVVRAEMTSELPPRHPHHRGFLELSYEFSSDHISFMQSDARGQISKMMAEA